MRALLRVPVVWVLVHLGSTITLAALDKAIRGELELRATCGMLDQKSPHQFTRPPKLLLAALALLALFLALHR